MRLEPWMFDIVLLGIAAEALILSIGLRRAKAERWAAPLIWFLMSGALLMASVRCAIASVPHELIAGLLLLSLLTHLACLWSAWRIIRNRA
jgi:hypothetical protein